MYKMKTIKTLALVVISLIALSSCEKDPKLEQKYLDLEMLADWQDFEIGENEEIIFKVTITNETGIDLDWQDVLSMKDGESYTGDIIVSAYRPDGITPYFEDKDSGYKDDAETITIEDGDTQVIIIVKPKAGKAGSFTIRARGINDDLVVTDPKTITFDDWTAKNVDAGGYKWLKVDCGNIDDIEVMWKEFDRQETGENFTADITVSVYSEDLATQYLEEKNHGYDGDARIFTLTPDTSSILYIRVTGVISGSYSIRVFSQKK